MSRAEMCKAVLDPESRELMFKLGYVIVDRRGAPFLSHKGLRFVDRWVEHEASVSR